MARRVAVAASGGRDSTALLHATCRVARELGIEVVALHVHHGLMPQADAWLTHVQRQCRRWARSGLPVTFVAHRVLERPAPGDSIEAWARRERYRSLGHMARSQGIALVLLAQHRRDQAETVLLQALRGAGPAGLAAMPRESARDGITWCRPWRDLPRHAIETYVHAHRLAYVDDESNQDRRLARSRLRQDVWPALEAAFSDAEAALAHAAERAHEAAQCLRELAAIDLAAVVTDSGALTVAAWRDLGDARRGNALRGWLAGQLGGGVPDSLVTRLLHELPGAGTGQQWPAGNRLLRLHRGRLALIAPPPSPDGPPCVLDLSTPGMHDVPGWGGGLLVESVRHGGVPAGLLTRAEIGPRRGGEQFQRVATGIPRSLKKSYQAAGLGVDARHGPLVHAGGHLLFAPGLGLDARAVALVGRPRRQLTWVTER
jgi:tRNA(Ile)-lysidine synthase